MIRLVSLQSPFIAATIFLGNKIEQLIFSFNTCGSRLLVVKVLRNF
jgi:hypothetical protein